MSELRRDSPDLPAGLELKAYREKALQRGEFSPKEEGHLRFLLWLVQTGRVEENPARYSVEGDEDMPPELLAPTLVAERMDG